MIRKIIFASICFIFSIGVKAQTPITNVGTNTGINVMKGISQIDSGIKYAIFPDTPANGRSRFVGNMIRKAVSGDTTLWQFYNGKWNPAITLILMDSIRHLNPNIFNKTRTDTPVVPFAPFSTLVQYQPDAISLGADTVIINAKDENIYSLSSFLSVDRGKTFVFVDTLISTRPADTAYNYTRLQHSGTILNATKDSLITLFTSGGGNNTCCFSIGYATAPRNNPLATIPKTRIRRLITAIQMGVDFGLADANYCAMGDIKKVGDTFYLYFDVGNLLTAPAAQQYIYVVLYKTTNFINLIPYGIVVRSQKPYQAVAFPSIVKLADSMYYMSVTEGQDGGLAQSWLRHLRSPDLMHWYDDLDGRFLELLGYNQQVTRVYAATYLYKDDGTNLRPKYYGDTMRFYYSASTSTNDRIFKADVFPSTQDGYIQENKVPTFLTTFGNFFNTNGTGGIGSNNNIGWNFISNSKPQGSVSAAGAFTFGLSVVSGGVTTGTGVRGIFRDTTTNIKVFLQNNTTGAGTTANGTMLWGRGNAFITYNLENDSNAFATNGLIRGWFLGNGNFGMTGKIHMYGGTTPTNGKILFGNTSTGLMELIDGVNMPAAVTATGGITPVEPVSRIPLNATAGNITYTITFSYPKQQVSVKRMDNSGNTITIKLASGTIDGAATMLLVTQNESATIVWDGTNGLIFD